MCGWVRVYKGACTRIPVCTNSQHLGCLTETLYIAPADESAPEDEERLVDVVPPLVADLQPPKTVQPRQSPLHNPTVPSQPLVRLDTAPGDAWGYAPLPQSLAAAGKVVGLVGMQLLGSLPRTAARLADRRDSVHGLLQDLRVVDIGRRVDHREWDAASVDHNVALRALFALVGGVRAGLLAPPGAATLAESKDALSQSICSASPKRSKSL